MDESEKIRSPVMYYYRLSCDKRRNVARIERQRNPGPPIDMGMPPPGFDAVQPGLQFLDGGTGGVIFTQCNIFDLAIWILWKRTNFGIPNEINTVGFPRRPWIIFAATAHIVVAALVAAIHVLLAALRRRKTWMAGTSPAMTPGGDWLGANAMAGAPASFRL